MGSSPSPFSNSFAFSEESPLGFQRERTQTGLVANHQENHKVLAGLFGLTTNDDGQECLPQLQSQMLVHSLERYNGELMERLQRLSVPSRRRSLFQLIEFGLYYLSNNLLSKKQTDGFLKWIIEQKYHGMIRSCLQTKMPTVHASATKILESAMRIGAADFFQYLIDSGIDRSSLKGIYGNKYLLKAARHGHIIIAQILLENGAEVNAPVSGEFPWPALQVATISRDVDMVRILLKAGAEVDAGDYRYWLSEPYKTALTTAISGNQIELVRILLEAGAHIQPFELRHSQLNSTQELHQLLVESSEIDDISICRQGILQAANGGTRDLLRYLARNVEDVKTIHEEKLNSASMDVTNAGARSFLQYLAEDVEEVHPRVKERLDSALEKAALDGDEIAVLSLLEIGVDPDDSLTLGSAVASGNINIVKILLSAGADLKSSDVLHVTTSDEYEKEKYEIFKLLLEEGLDVKPDEARILIEALSNDNLKMVQLLISLGVDVNKLYTDERTCNTALQLAVWNENTACVRALLDAGADVDAPGNSIDEYEAGRINTNFMQKILKTGAYFDPPEREFEGLTALQAAAETENVEIVRILLDVGADVNAPATDFNGFTALQAAAGIGNTEIVRILLDVGADVNAAGSEFYGKTALQAAMLSETTGASKLIELVRMLLEAGADPNVPTQLQNHATFEKNSPYGTVLQIAVSKGNIKLVRLLLDFGAKINDYPRGSPERSPIQTAAEAGDADLVALLLEEGADVNMAAGEYYGRTAIQAACSAERPTMKLIEILVQAGANIHAPAVFKGGLTALQGAAVRGHMGIALKLLELGADVNAEPAQFSGRTALDGAAEHGHLDMVQMLLNAGAMSKGFVANSYKRAIKLANRNGHFAVARLLEARDCDVFF